MVSARSKSGQETQCPNCVPLDIRIESEISESAPPDESTEEELQIIIRSQGEDAWCSTLLTRDGRETRKWSAGAKYLEVSVYPLLSSDAC